MSEGFFGINCKFLHRRVIDGSSGVEFLRAIFGDECPKMDIFSQSTVKR